jgi:serine/threonine protein phosphatase PrpC
MGGDGSVRHFVDLANERGGKDNITVVLVEID